LQQLDFRGDFEGGLSRFKTLSPQLLLFQQMPDRLDRGLIRDPSLMRAIPAKRRIVATAISTSCIAG